MSGVDEQHISADETAERKYPPVDILATVALGLAIVGGIFMAAHVPRHIPLAMPVLILSAALVLLCVAAFLLLRIEDFAWDKFRLVYKWAMLAYLIEASVIGFAFVRDHTRGGPRVVVIGMLAVFAVSVPTTIAYTVARFAKGLDGTS